MQAGLSQTRAGLLQELMKGDGSHAEVSERMAHHGIMADEPWCLIAIDCSGSDAKQLHAEATRRLANEGVGFANAYLESLDARFLAAWYQQSLCILLRLRLQDEDVEVREFTQGLLQQASFQLELPDLRAGVSEAFTGPSAGPEALLQAREALLLGRRRRIRSLSAAVMYADMSLHVRALNSVPDEFLQGLRSRVVRPLHEADARRGTHLYETLVTFLDLDRSLDRTAQALYVHRNTLARRLEHVERIIGLDLRDSDALADVCFAVRAEEILHLRLEE